MIDIEDIGKAPPPAAPALDKFNRSDWEPTEDAVPGSQTIYVKTFGCSHNISDSEVMMGLLADYGYRITDNPDEGDAWVINSCTVKNPSQDAMSTKIETAIKQGKPAIVTGCVPQGDRNIPIFEDCSIVGVTQIDRIVEVVEQALLGNKVQLLTKKALPSLDLPKIRRNKLVEIIPISTGCLGSCTYCKTKHARGHLGSYALEEIVNRVKSSLAEGVKDIWLTSEDSGAYGRDIGTNLPTLLKAVAAELTGDCMLRVGMTNPPFILEHLKEISEVLNHPRVYSFLHIPVQAGNDKVLTDMNREYTVAEFSRVVDTIRANVPGIHIITDIICGFPGETDEEFNDTMALVEKYKFPSVYISQFYPRPGTPAFNMKRVDTKKVKSRSREMTKLFESYTCHDHMLGTRQTVYLRDLEEGRNRDQMIGHTKQFAKVILPRKEELIGGSVECIITSTTKWHCMGEIAPPKKQTSFIYLAIAALLFAILAGFIVSSI